MSLFGTLKGIATELLSLPIEPKPYQPPIVTRQSRDRNGYTVLHINAANYAEAARLTDGYTVAGPVYKALVHVGHNKWQLRVECNETETW